MYIKRADLIAWALVYLTTTCFILTYAAPHKLNHTLDEGSKPIMLSTPQTASPDKNGMGKDDKEKAETTPPGDPSERPKDYMSSKEPPATDENTEEFLYYQITKRIKKCNLTLSDIREVLLQKDDDGDQFMYTLADKLGYMVDGKHDDPHIPVIKSHKKKLITLLETKKAGLSTTTSQEKSKLDSQPATSEKPPMSAEPESTSQIGYEVATAIRELGADALYDLLSAPSFSDAFVYKVGIQLGYSANDQYMNYLENKDVKELRGLMQRILDSKMSNNNLPTSNGRQGSEGQGPGQQISGERDPNQNGPTQGEGSQDRDDVGPSQESFIKDPKLSAAAGDGQGGRGDTTGNKRKGLSDVQELPDDDGDVTDGGYPPNEPQSTNAEDSSETNGENQDHPVASEENTGGDSQTRQPSVDSGTKGQGEVDKNDDNDDGIVAGGLNDGGNTQGGSNPPPQTNGTPKASITPQMVNSKGGGEEDPDDDDRKNQEQEDTQEKKFDGFNIMDQQTFLKNNKNFMAFLKDKYPVLYEQLQSDETSRDAIVKALNLYTDNEENIESEGGDKDANLKAEPEGGESVLTYMWPQILKV